MKYMHKNKLVPPTSTYGQGNHAPTVEEATDVFIAWLKHRNLVHSPLRKCVYCRSQRRAEG